MSARIAALILNFNGAADTRVAVESLREQHAEIVPLVLDNGSTVDESIDLRRALPDVDVERVEKNLGFSRGVNHLARRALAMGVDYLLLLNSDARFRPGDSSIERLVDALRRDPTSIAVGPVVENEDGTIQSAGYDYSLWFPAPRAVRRVPLATTRVRGFLSGSCMLVDARRFAELGGLDGDFFLYGEDLDFAFRARALGFSQSIVPTARVIHRRAASSKLYSERYVYTALRGNLLVIAKHARWYQRPTALLTSIAASVALIVLALRRGRRAAPARVARAWLDFYAGRWGGLTGEPLEPSVRPSLADYARAAA